MADLSDIAAAQSVKIIGCGLSGVESTPVDSTADGRLKVDNVTTAISHNNRVDVSSAARTTSGNSGILDSNGFGCISFSVNITAVSGTKPTLQITFDVSEDGTNWSELIKTVRFTGTTTYRQQRISLSAKYYRFKWLVLGTTPSFTFSITSTLKPYSVGRNVVLANYADVSLTTVGNTSSAFLAADTNYISLMSIRAADGGSNGKFRIQASNDGINWANVGSEITQGSNTTILTTFNQMSFRYYRVIVTNNTNAGTRVLDLHWGAS